MNLSNIPLTGEKPIAGWIIAIIVISALAIAGSILYPKFAAKKKDNNKKDD